MRRRHVRLRLNTAVETRVRPCLANDTAMVSIGIRLAVARLANHGEQSPGLVGLDAARS